MKDYSIKLQDKAGKTCEVFICGDSVSEMLALGYSEDQAKEEVEQNQFQNAIARGDIGSDCWIAPPCQ